MSMSPDKIRRVHPASGGDPLREGTARRSLNDLDTLPLGGAGANDRFGTPLLLTCHSAIGQSLPYRERGGELEQAGHRITFSIAGAQSERRGADATNVLLFRRLNSGGLGLFADGLRPVGIDDDAVHDAVVRVAQMVKAEGGLHCRPHALRVQ